MRDMDVYHVALAVRVSCRSVDVLKRCGCSVQQATLPGKAHGMIDSPAEMRAAMEFWGTRLRSRPADASFVEVPAPAGAASRRPQ
jgi:hypothetical protein